MSGHVSQYRLKSMTGSGKADMQAQWLERNYGIFIVPDSNGKLFLSKDVLHKAQLKKTEDKGFKFTFDG